MKKHIIAIISIICLSAYHIESQNRPTIQKECEENEINEDAAEPFPINPRTSQPYIPIKSPFKNCKALFNEFELVADETQSQFIELAKYCDAPSHCSSFSLSKYQIVVIDEKSKIVAMCKLRGQMHFRPIPGHRHAKSHWFFVLGDENVENVDMKFRECQIDKTYNGRFPHSAEFPYAVILLWAPHEKTLNSVELYCDSENRCTKKSITYNQMQALKNHLQDMYIVGSLTSYLNCDTFQEIYQDRTARLQYIIRDWSVFGEVGKSLSRCGQSTEALNPESIKTSVPTPGTRNKCRHATTVTLETVLPLLNNPVTKDWKLGNRCHSAKALVRGEAPPLTPHEIEEIHNFGIEHEIEIETENDMEDFNMEWIEFEDEGLDCEGEPVHVHVYNEQDINDYKFLIQGLDQSRTYINEDCNLYQTQLLQIPSRDIDTSFIINNSSTCWWLDFTPKRGTTAAKATCKICKKLHTAGVLVDRPKSNENSKLVTQGDWSSDSGQRRRYNRNLIQSHLESKFHQISLQYFTNIDNGKTGDALYEAMMMKDKPYYQFFEATVNLALLVYTSVRMGLPFGKFRVLMETVRYMNNNVGYVHHTKEGSAKMLGVISDSLRMQLIFHLLTETPKICIILDGSTSVSGHSNIAVLFQTWDSNDNPRPVTYHYILSHLKFGEKGAGYFRVFIEQLENDKLTEFVKANTIAMTADGASSMKFTFYEQLKEYITNKDQFIYNHCYAHRLQLVIESTMAKFVFLKYIDQRLNRLHSFFGRKASKKQLLVRDNMALYNVKEFALSRIFDERWVATRNRAYTRIQKHWKLVVSTLDQIIENDKEFATEDRNTALDLKEDLTDPTFLLHIGFLIDITEEQKPISLDFQRKNSSLIGKYTLINHLKTSMIRLKTHEGTKLLEISNQILAVEEQLDVPNTLLEKLQLIETEVMEYYEVGLDPQVKNENRTLYKMWDEYFEDIALQIDNYFPPNDLKNHFDIFYAPNFPQDLENSQNSEYGRVKLLALNAKFSWHKFPTILHASFLRPVHSIVSDPDFLVKKGLHPERFWYYYLQRNVEWTAELKTVLRYVMTISPSSADAERSFSLVTATQTTGRYNLATTTIDKILRVKINGEENIQKVNAFTYAREFISKFCKADEIGRVKPNFLGSHEEFDLSGKRLKTIFEKRSEN